MERSRSLRRRIVETSGLSPIRRVLADWQSKRLAEPYADFHRQPRYRLAVEFFLNDLYGPRDFGQRDADVERVYPVMARVLSGHALDSITQALELHALSQELDAAMVEILARDLAVTDHIDAGIYAEAFRRCGERSSRLRQIELIEQVGRTLDEVVHNPLIYGTVLRARGCRRSSQDSASCRTSSSAACMPFAPMRGADEFIAAIGERERRMLDELLGNGEVPDLAEMSDVLVTGEQLYGRVDEDAGQATHDSAVDADELQVASDLQLDATRGVIRHPRRAPCPRSRSPSRRDSCARCAGSRRRASG